MKIRNLGITFLSIVGLSSSMNFDERYKDMFKQYVSKFEHSHYSGKFSYETFRENMLKIEQHNLNAENGGHLLGMNHFTAVSHEEL